VFDVSLEQARQGRNSLAIDATNLGRNEPWPAADSAYARCPAAALIRDTAVTLEDYLTGRIVVAFLWTSSSRGAMSGKNDTLHGVDFHEAFSRGGKGTT
jgi:hypothetical protein